MNFSKNLQMDVSELKSLIKDSDSLSRQIYYIAALTAKGVLTLLFCSVFVIVYSVLFGFDNSSVGVTVLLCVLTFQSTDFGVSLKDSFKIFTIYFLIIMFLPMAANMVNPFFGLLINIVGIFIIYVLCCSKVEYFNHSIMVLGYLLIYGYNVTGKLYYSRVVAIAVGFLLTCLVFFHKHYKMKETRKISDIIKEFGFKNLKSQWQVKATLAVTLSIFIGEILGLPKAMWAGIAAMSVLVPFEYEVKNRFVHRIQGTVLGIIIFFIICLFLPENVYGFIGIAGGFCLSFCSKYISKVPFNTCGGLCVAVGTYGLKLTMIARLVQNVFGVLCAVIITYIISLYNKKWNTL